MGECCGLAHVVIGGVRPAVAQVVHQCVVEQHRVLWHDADTGPQALLLQFAHVVTVDAHGAGVDVVEAVQQARDCGLACAARAHERHLLPGFDHEADSAEDGAVGVIGEVHVVELDAAGVAVLERQRVRRVDHLRTPVQDIHHPLDQAQCGPGGPRTQMARACRLGSEPADRNRSSAPCADTGPSVPPSSRPACPPRWSRSDRPADCPADRGHAA